MAELKLPRAARAELKPAAEVAGLANELERTPEFRAVELANGREPVKVPAVERTPA